MATLGLAFSSTKHSRQPFQPFANAPNAPSAAYSLTQGDLQLDPPIHDLLTGYRDSAVVESNHNNSHFTNNNNNNQTLGESFANIKRFVASQELRKLLQMELQRFYVQKAVEKVSIT